jgi:xanthine dehydrogenase FAD-binding subunit
VQPFAYLRPTTTAEVVAALATGNARVLAGGTDLLPQLREGRRTVATVVDLKALPELSGLTRSADGGWRIGAATTVGALGRDAAFAAEHAPLLAAARLIGCLQIQNRASLGGNLCNGAPSADAIPLLISLGSEAEIAGPTGRRRLAVETFVTAPGRTVLGPADVLVALHLPPQLPRSAAAYRRFTPRREMDIAVAGSACAVALGADGTITAARIALASVAPVPLLVPSAGAVLIGHKPSCAVFAAASDIAANAAEPISDARASADYRRHLVGVLTRRALETCAADLGVSLA